MKKFLVILESVGFTALALLVNLIFTFIPMFFMSRDFILDNVNAHNLTKLLLDYMSSNNRLILVTLSGTACVALLFFPWYMGVFRKDVTSRAKEVYTAKSIPALIVTGLFIQIGISIILTFVLPLFENVMAQYDEMMSMIAFDNGYLTVLTVGIIAPIAEESVFRGVMFRNLRRHFSFFAANLVQALLFGIYHLNIVQFVYAFVIGLILGFFAERTKRILPSMLLHGVINISGLFLDILLPEVMYSSIWLTVVVLVMSIAFVLIGLLLVPDAQPIFIIRTNRLNANRIPYQNIPGYDATSIYRDYDQFYEE